MRGSHTPRSAVAANATRIAALTQRTPSMPKKPQAAAEYVLYDTFYEDGSRRSNRRLPVSVMHGPDKPDNAARLLLEQMDREIAEKSGVAPAPIASVKRSDKK
jgi:hypothetical protein